MTLVVLYDEFGLRFNLLWDCSIMKGFETVALEETSISACWEAELSQDPYPE